MNNQTCTTKNSEKQNIGACARSAQHWTLDHNKGFKIPTFCIPYANFEVDEDRLGSRYSPTSFFCLCIPRWLDWLLVGVLAGGGSMAMALGVSDRWQVTCDNWHATWDTWHVTHDFLKIYLLQFLAGWNYSDFFVSVPLSAHIERLSVSRVRDFFSTSSI